MTDEVEILTGIYALLLNIRDYQYFLVSQHNPDLAEHIRREHAAGKYVLDEVSLVRREEG